MLIFWASHPRTRSKEKGVQLLDPELYHNSVQKGTTKRLLLNSSKVTLFMTDWFIGKKRNSRRLGR